MMVWSKLTRVSFSAALLGLLFTTGRATAQELLFRLEPNTSTPGDQFGIATGIDDVHAVVGASGDATLGLAAGSAYLFDVLTGGQTYKLHANDGQQSDVFGSSVSISGNFALVGAYGKSTPGWLYHGAAYLFDVSTGQQVYKLLPAGVTAGDYFGYSVSIDGDRAVIGAVGDTVAGAWSGAAYLYDTSTGMPLFTLIPPDGAPFNNFGCSVAISGDRALIGAQYHNAQGNNAGAAYLYDVSNGQLLFTLYANDASAEDYFGSSVAIRGNRAVVGAYEANVAGAGNGAGKAYVFDVATGQQLLKLTASDALPDDNFGRSVAISNDRVVVGANNDDDLGGNSGSAYVFSVGTGEQLFKLLADNGTGGDQFGLSVAAGNGRTLIGADQHHSARGLAYLFGLVEPGIGFCFGDPGSGTPCPCVNDNDGSVPGSGCDNGVFPEGGRLAAAGAASVAHDTMTLTVSGVEPSNTGLFFQANNAVNGGAGNPFGDGLRCAGGGLVRLQIVTASSTGSAHTTVALATKGGISAWEIKRYQYWYRTVTNPPCGLGVNDFNLTNGYEVMWLP